MAEDKKNGWLRIMSWS